MSASKTIAFFGATGGSANAALVLALQGGYDCTALARTPSKLHDMLVAAGVSESAISQHLTIIKGDARSVAACRATLAPVTGHDYTTSSTDKSDEGSAYPFDAARSVSIVVSGIGMDPFVRNPDLTICQDWAKTFVEASSSLPESKRPFVAAISTTGITSGPRDVPLLFVPLYHVVLKNPHIDKRVMEETLLKAQDNGNVSGTCLVRPSLLFSGEENKREDIRVGNEASPAVGYTVNRKDVGRWIYEEVIKGDENAWRGEKPSVTV